MPQSYDPNLGVLSAFEGVGNAISDVGKMGLVDAMETRRSKMENELRMQLKGADQEFSVEQADTEDARKVKAATTKHGRDVELQGLKNEGIAGKASASNKEMANKEMLSPDGSTAVSADFVRKLYADANGLNQDMINWEQVEPDFNIWMKGQGYTWRNAGPVTPPPPKSEEDFKSYYFNAFPDATDEEYQQDLQRDRSKGLIAPAAAPSAAAPGVMDAVAGDADAAQQGYSGKFGGEQPGVLSDVQETAEPTKKPIQPWKENRGKKKLDNERKSLQKYKSEAPTGNRRGRTPAVDKAVKQVTTALKKENIKMVSKENLKLALNKKSFIDSLTAEQIKEIRNYLDSQ